MEQVRHAQYAITLYSNMVLPEKFVVCVRLYQSIFSRELIKDSLIKLAETPCLKCHVQNKLILSEDSGGCM